MNAIFRIIESIWSHVDAMYGPHILAQFYTILKMNCVHLSQTGILLTKPNLFTFFFFCIFSDLLLITELETSQVASSVISKI